ncbi:hypothetical protein HFP68_27705 [Bacillus sp. CB28A.1]
MGSSPYFNKNVSYQTSSIPITEVTQKKSRIIAAEAVTLPKRIMKQPMKQSMERLMKN